MIRAAVQSDAPAICRIYNYYVSHTTVSFETRPVSEEAMSRRIKEVQRSYSWIVYEAEGTVVGYAYATRWKERSAYDLTAETAVYVDRDFQGRGIGKKLYSKLIDECRSAGLHLLIGGIALPNEASIALHERMGFEYTGKFSEVGKKAGKWVDVGYWVLNLG